MSTASDRKYRRRRNIVVVVLVGLSCVATVLALRAWDARPDESRPTTVGPFETSGYDMRPMQPIPYARNAEQLFDLHDPSYELSVDGVVIKRWPDVDEPVNHPVDLSWYILPVLESYKTSGDRAYLDRATVNAEKLLGSGEDVDGALWFPYDFDYTLRGEIPMPAPWYSGMAQGMVLSVFARMYEETGEQRWRDAADATFASFSELARDDRRFVYVSPAGNLWFEEYVTPGSDPSHVINGHMYAMWGLYDYARISDDPQVRELFDGAATTIRDTFSEWRVEGGVSYYCAGDLCKETDWRPADYHRGVAWQLEDLSLMTGDRAFLTMAKALREDASVS
ncbi:D-glucuronyl C5-epimerase family protein [Salana multivorans]